MRRLALLLLLATCASPTASTDGEWFGDMTPDQAPPNCPPGRASLVLRRASALFTPNEGTQTLNGTITPEGTVTAARNTTGADKKPYTVTLAAHVEGGSITGTYATPRCRYTVRLRRS
jgi:hypothetical protein